ncbi:MAG: DsbA family oxidoreductase [Rhodobiaceae bacterium]|nr:DsbA family oxidoreductase [Rhodobiaceae bacterium]MCC0057522.1 DsbA family oxidoreductase [Rhodobiaceae bacterium]
MAITPQLTDDSPVIIDVISDVMCPWCLVGKRMLRKALTLRPDTPVQIRWRPYQLDPTIPKGGMDRKEYLRRKFGEAAGGQMYQRLKDIGEAEGIEFNFSAIPRSPNTLDAHRLIRWAANDGVQEKVVDRLFAVYFSEGGDIESIDTLKEIAREAGMDADLVASLLEKGADIDLVKREADLARQMGVDGVPCFVFDEQFAVMGAQPPDVLAQYIDRAIANRAKTAEPSPGGL